MRCGVFYFGTTLNESLNMAEENKDDRLGVEEVRKKFGELHRLKNYRFHDKLLADREERLSLLVLQTVDPVSVHGRDVEIAPSSYVVLADRSQLLELANYILQELDPSLEDEILQTLKSIERLLQNRHDS